jgi:ABC-2 type transport system ATP-binding protein
MIDLENPSEQQQLAALVTTGQVASLRTREFDFHATFLKLTGQIYE